MLHVFERPEVTARLEVSDSGCEGHESQKSLAGREDLWESSVWFPVQWLGPSAMSDPVAQGLAQSLQPCSIAQPSLLWKLSSLCSAELPPCCGSDSSSHPFTRESGAMIACWSGRQQLEPLLPFPGWTNPLPSHPLSMAETPLVSWQPCAAAPQLFGHLYCWGWKSSCTLRDYKLPPPLHVLSSLLLSFLHENRHFIK